MMNGCEKSDPAIVAAKPTNKAERSAAEPVEPRAGTKGNADQTGTLRAQDREGASHGLDRVRQAARDRKKERFTALLHHVSVDLLEEAFFDSQEERRSWRGRTDVGDLRTRPRAQARRPAFAGSSGSVSGVAQPAGLYSQAGWSAASAGGCRARGQDRPTGDGEGAERHLRGRLPRLQLRVPTWTRRA